jgi:DNA-binding XRE family transcriptional regulator
MKPRNADENVVEFADRNRPVGSALPARAPSPAPLWRELAGQVLRSERIEQGRTLQQIAERAGVSAQYLSEVERGRKDASSEMLESICGALGLGLSQLLAAAGERLLPTTVALPVSNGHAAQPFPASGPVHPATARGAAVVTLMAA